jgi:hypothetical protein
VTESSADPGLSAAETRAAEALLAGTWGERAEVRAAEPIWRRSHVFRLRLLTWLSSFIGTAGRTGALPRLHGLARVLHDQLSLRWPETPVPDYPALARPGSAVVQVPGWWQPGL